MRMDPPPSLAWAAGRMPAATAAAISVDTGAADNITSDNTLQFSGTAEANNTVEVFLDAGGGPVWVEVKNVTLLDGDCLRFPDAVSERGRKHLDLLAAAVGQDAVLHGGPTLTRALEQMLRAHFEAREGARETSEAIGEIPAEERNRLRALGYGE